jgi:hypothetical protein
MMQFESRLVPRERRTGRLGGEVWLPWPERLSGSVLGARFTVSAALSSKAASNQLLAHLLESTSGAATNV